MLTREGPATMRDISKVAIAEIRWCIDLYCLAKTLIGATRHTTALLAMPEEISMSQRTSALPLMISASGSGLQSGLRQSSQPVAMDKSLPAAGDASDRSTGSSYLQPRGTDLLCVFGHAPF